MRNKRNRLSQAKRKNEKVEIDTISRKDNGIVLNGYKNEINQLSKKYEENIDIFHKLLLDYENKLIRLKEQNLILSNEKKSLTEVVKEYELLYKEWSIEKKNLVTSQQKAIQQIDGIKNTMSFRLGYAIIFGFKSWDGFKNLLHTVLTLRKEKNKKKLLVDPSKYLLKQPYQKVVSWNSQKPVLQWTLSQDIDYLSDFSYKKFNPNHAETFLLDQKGVSIQVDCTSAKQMVVNVNAFSLDQPDAIKQALLTILFYDESGNKVVPLIDLPFSQRLGKYYFYLNTQRNISDYVFLLVPDSAVKVELGVHLWDVKSNIYVHNEIGISVLSEGISVILPTYKGEKTILKCLESLAKQTLPFPKFEVLIVINGEKDDTPFIVENFKQKFPQLNIQTYELEEGNVSKARNYAIKKSSRGWITFIDDDDFLAENYLNALYQYAMFNAITVTGIEDINDHITVRSSIMDQLQKASKKDTLTYFDVTSTLTMNACKLAPSYMVKSVHYDITLKSGEDVVFWCDVLNRFRANITLIPSYEKDNYKRLIRENSVSRKIESYDFNVSQRLEVIKRLIGILSDSQYKNIDAFIQSKIDAQAGLIKRYLKKNSHEYTNFINQITEMDLHNRFINEINHIFADTLVISYCFAPYIDTSGVVMSKRIKAMVKPVDIITNSMNRVREVDERLLQISEYNIGNHHELDTPQSFANWKAISQFADTAVDTAYQMMKYRKIYKNLYSRAMWPASHIAAAVIKMKYPKMKWTAEFSDPILMDVSANERYEELPVDWLEEHGFIPHTHSLDQAQNLFYWCEKLAYIYADELIFTNQNQLNYMLSYADEDLKEIIFNKAVILPQPTLDREFYKLSPIKLEKEADKFHLAYFGSFYVNRGFKPFIEAWNKLPDDKKKYLKLHIYTQQDADSILNQVPAELQEQILIQKYVSYFDFLALTDQFDGLIVMDAETKGLKINNPYLPSKLSDYLGSNTKIFALTELDSPMSQINNEKILKVDMYDIEEIMNSLKELVNMNSK